LTPGGPRGWLPVALAAAAGLTAGLLVALALGALRGEDIRTVTVERGAGPAPGGTVVARTAVPSVVGERLDIAKDRVRRASFIAEVQGGGTLGVIRERNWEVTSQDPVGGQLLQTGSTVRLRIERR
jgi:hypothetical protein